MPIGFMTSDVLASNLVVVIANANLYHFGVLTSNVFMSWMRAVCGRLKSDYRITKDNVYNNFPWPTPTEAQKAKIEETAQGI
ncbi:type IIL restriction-modification enzyme MmeI, partial [Acinetobacter baumannii]|uniref:type IIL restriction-modification enzyme MmeI n=1 Tax=Acinetobacter baumannii TaxID=470 RepID=UPI003D08F901